MSPAARGLVPGLLLALAVAFGVLALDRHWLLPSLDETGVRYLAAAPQLAAGATPRIPLASWDAADATSGLEGFGTLMPMLMATLSSAGTRTHVAALWVLAGSAALAVLSLAWAVGGAAGLPAALLAGVLVAMSPSAADAATALHPALPLAALVALLVGVMTYQPGWSPLHGALGTLAWLAHPAGVGAVAAAVAWPAALPGPRRRRLRGALLAAFPAVVFLAAGALRPILAPPAGTPRPGALLDGARGLLGAAAPFPRGWWSSPVVALLLLAALGALVGAAAGPALVGPGFGGPARPALPAGGGLERPRPARRLGVGRACRGGLAPGRSSPPGARGGDRGPLGAAAARTCGLGAPRGAPALGRSGSLEHEGPRRGAPRRGKGGDGARVGGLAGRPLARQPRAALP